MHKFYASAPLTYCFINETIKNSVRLDPSVEALIMDEKPITCSTLTEVIPSVTKMLAQAKDTCKLFEEQEVRPAFFKYDADRSGGIDRDELRNCLSDLGYSNMSTQDLEAAF
jgi:Ca2+-binding EF-hand superfamily protein